MSNESSYRQSLISYIDILGFSELIEGSKDNSSEVKRILEILKSAQKDLSINPSGFPSVSKEFKSENFSDLTVRARFIDKTNEIETAFQEIDLIGLLQFGLILENQLLIRGGICTGDLYFDQEIVFGPGLIKAYRLESEFAIYPRIVVDRDLAFAVNDWCENDSDPAPIVRGDDGAFFIDYLTSATSFDLRAHVPEANPEEGLIKAEKHKAFVIKEIKSIDSKCHERVKQKRAWLGIYHNASIDRLIKIHEQYAERLTGLKIDEDSLRF